MSDAAAEEAALQSSRAARPDFGTVAEAAARKLHDVRPAYRRAEPLATAERWELSDWRAVLRLENHNFEAGPKAEFVRARFRCGMTRYVQRLNQIIDEPEALEWDPQLVYRLRAARDVRKAARAARGRIIHRGDQ